MITVFISTNIQVDDRKENFYKQKEFQLGLLDLLFFTLPNRYGSFYFSQGS